jgi:hypothetical protein
MTQAYDALEEGPQVGINISDLNYEERAEARQIKVRKTPGSSTRSGGKFTIITYLVGDEDAAAERFVAENETLLDELDFGGRNVLQEAVDREMYDRILHVAGIREVTKYPSVVHETRRDGTRWIVRRDVYEEAHNRRYTINSPNAARVPPDVDLREAYDAHGQVVTSADVKDWGVEGATVRVLDYFCDAEALDCKPLTIKEVGPAIEKLD